MNLEVLRNQNGMCPNTNYIRAAHRFLAEVVYTISKSEAYTGSDLPTQYKVSSYAIPGCEMIIGPYRIWLGVNGKRITFVSNLNTEHKAALQVFYPAIIQYTHGWKLACYPLGQQTNMRCVIEANSDLVIPIRPAGMTYGETPMQVTDEGNYYVHEVAQFIQCFIKVMQTNQFECADIPPSNI